MRSLPEIANERVDSFTSSISFIREQVSYKGFLGPSLRENRSLPSVGNHAARRAGIILDENGKMRCPPGTPNANQFTDMQMSNCMVPSAETAVRGVLDLARNGIPDAPDFLEDKKPSRTVEALRGLSSDVKESLSKRIGNLTDEQKNTIGKIAMQSAYWATYFGNLSDIGSVVNDVTGAVGDSDSFDGIQLLTGIYMSGGAVAIQNTLEIAREKWNKSREQVKEYHDAFMSRMERLKVRAGELSAEMGESLRQTLGSVREKIMKIMVEPLAAKSYISDTGSVVVSHSVTISPDILTVIGINLEDWYAQGINNPLSTFQNDGNRKYEQRRIRTAAYER